MIQSDFYKTPDTFCNLKSHFPIWIVPQKLMWEKKSHPTETNGKISIDSRSTQIYLLA